MKKTIYEKLNEMVNPNDIGCIVAYCNNHRIVEKMPLIYQIINYIRIKFANFRIKRGA